MTKRIRQIIRTLIIIVALASNIGCDQISKNIVRRRIEYHEQFSFINNHLTLTKMENTGAFLSLGNALPKLLNVILLTVVPLIFLAFAFIYVLTKNNLSNLTAIGISFIIGGGVGNIYDRIVHGSVTDFLHIDLGIFQTGVFNMADVSIMTGALIILFSAYFKYDEIKFSITGKKGTD